MHHGEWKLMMRLISTQRQIQELAAVEAKNRRDFAARCQELEPLNSEAERVLYSDAMVTVRPEDRELLQRVAELRKQIGAIVRGCVSHVKSSECIRAWHGRSTGAPAPSLRYPARSARQDGRGGRGRTA